GILGCSTSAATTVHSRRGDRCSLQHMSRLCKKGPPRPRKYRAPRSTVSRAWEIQRARGISQSSLGAKRGPQVDGQSSLGDQLVAVGMRVAPAPVIPLHDHSLPAVRTIRSVVFHQVAPVGALFASVPVVVVAVVAVVNADHGNLLRTGFGDNNGRCNNGRCNNGSCQKK